VIKEFRAFKVNKDFKVSVALMVFQVLWAQSV